MILLVGTRSSDVDFKVSVKVPREILRQLAELLGHARSINAYLTKKEPAYSRKGFVPSRKDLHYLKKESEPSRKDKDHSKKDHSSKKKHTSSKKRDDSPAKGEIVPYNKSTDSPNKSEVVPSKKSTDSPAKGEVVPYNKSTDSPNKSEVVSSKKSTDYSCRDASSDEFPNGEINVEYSWELEPGEDPNNRMTLAERYRRQTKRLKAEMANPEPYYTIPKGLADVDKYFFTHELEERPSRCFFDYGRFTMQPKNKKQ